MPPALRPSMQATGSPDSPGAVSSSPGDPLVPLLPLNGSAPDPVAISTWHQALGASVAVTVPHDLLALWLFPDAGGTVLLGPDELSRDRVEVPLPAPAFKQDQLYQLEEVLRRARYASAIAIPVRHQGRDVAVMLVGGFARGMFAPVQALALHRLALSLEPSLAGLAAVMAAVSPHVAVEPAMTADELPDRLARATVEAPNGPELVRRVSGVLYPLLPHDRVEVLTLGAGGMLIPLSGNSPRRRWSAGGGTVDPFTAIVEQFGQGTTLLIEDLGEIGAEGAWTVSGAGASQGARSVLGARLTVAGTLVGYLLLGSVARDAYRPEEEDTLELAALLIAPRVHGLRLAAEVEALRNHPSAPDNSTAPLARSAEALAGTSHLGEALAAYGKALGELLPHERILLHLRWGEDEVVALDPASPRPFADLPALPLAEFAGAAVLRGEREWLIRSIEGSEELVVPLRIAGRVVGTLAIRGTFPSTREASRLALHFADVLAPHLELVRRGAAINGPGGSRLATPAPR